MGPLFVIVEHSDGGMRNRAIRATEEAARSTCENLARQAAAKAAEIEGFQNGYSVRLETVSFTWERIVDVDLTTRD